MLPSFFYENHIHFFDVINENKYINIASMYNDLNPKYIALYSKQPPTIAPIIFEDKATITERAIFNSYEKSQMMFASAVRECQILK